jgi:hypothetical protein
MTSAAIENIGITIGIGHPIAKLTDIIIMSPGQGTRKIMRMSIGISARGIRGTMGRTREDTGATITAIETGSIALRRMRAQLHTSRME